MGSFARIATDPREAGRPNETIHPERDFNGANVLKQTGPERDFNGGNVFDASGPVEVVIF